LAVPITLPYEFDTTREGTLVVKIMLGLGFIVAVEIVYSFAFSRSWAAVLQLSLTGAVLLFFILRFVKNLTGSIGTITANEIVVKRRNVYGLEFSGPAGVFRFINLVPYVYRRVQALRLQKFKAARTNGFTWWARTAPWIF
jgi:hypothetical protein